MKELQTDFKNKPRLNYLDFIRGIAVIFVVYIHMSIDKFSIFPHGFMHRMCIPAFVFVTGYMFLFDLKDSYFKVVNKRVGIMIKYFFIYSFLSQLIKNGFQFSIIDVITNVLFGKIDTSINLALWYAPFYISLVIVAFLEIKIVYYLSISISYILPKQNNENIKYLYMPLIIFSILLAVIGHNIEIANNFYFIKHTLIMQPFAMLGFICHNIDAYLNEINNKDKYNRKIIFCFRGFVLIFAGLIGIFITLNSPIVDIYPLLIYDIKLFYLSISTLLVSFLIISMLLQKLFDNIFIFNMITFVGRKSLHICFLHLLLYNQFPIFLSQFPMFSEFINNKKIFRDVFETIFLLFVSIIFSYVFDKIKKN